MLNNLQYLRGIAALLVVIGHTLQLVSEKLAPIGHPLLKHFEQTGAIGVDIFFVISGFIMFHVTPNDTGPAAARTFWLRRMVRVMPLYWIMTTIVVAFYLTGIPRTQIDLSASYLTLSYLLLPVESLRGWMEPVMPVGWTLIYEMFFYFCFGLALLLPARLRAISVTLAMGSLVLVGQLAPELRERSIVFATYSSTLLIEFLFGVWIARAYQSGLRIPTALALALMGVGFAVLSAFYIGVELTRFLISGVPAAAVVFGAVMLEKNLGRSSRPIRPLKVLGDASYSLYLGHPVVLFAVSYSTRFVGELGTTGLLSFFASALAAQIVLSILSFRLLERPITNVLNRRIAGHEREPRKAAARV